jgi:hypothetical protein
MMTMVSRAPKFITERFALPDVVETISVPLRTPYICPGRASSQPLTNRFPGSHHGIRLIAATDSGRHPMRQGRSIQRRLQSHERADLRPIAVTSTRGDSGCLLAWTCD